MPRRRPTADQLLQFAQRTKLVNLEAPVERIAEGAKVIAPDLAEEQGVNILMLSGYFIVYPAELEDESSSRLPREPRG